MLALVALALAEDPSRVWSTLYDARLVEAVDGTPDVAVRLYTELLDEMAATDPSRPEVSYWLGRARLTLGHTDEAVAALRAALEDPTMRPEAGALLSLIELRSRAVDRLPQVWRFDKDIGGFVRGWQGADRGDVGVQTLGGNGVLVWQTVVRVGESDDLSIGLSAGTDLAELRFKARAVEFPTSLRVRASDGAGGRFEAALVAVPTDRWIEAAVPVSSMRSVDPAFGAATPHQVRSVTIEDVTGLLSSDRGANTILLDDVELRDRARR